MIAALALLGAANIADITRRRGGPLVVDDYVRPDNRMSASFHTKSPIANAERLSAAEKKRRKKMAKRAALAAKSDG